MSHPEKQEIFNRYANSKGFTDWESLQQAYKLNLFNKDELMLHVFAACDLVQEQQQKRIAENARTEVVFVHYRPASAVDKDSITNPQNKIQ